MKKTTKYGLAFLFLGIILVLSMVLSSALLITPASSSTIGGTAAVLNATNSSLPIMLNCSFYAMSSSTANSSWSFLGAATNLTANAASINRTFNSFTLEDANNYQFNATCRNSSNAITSSVNTGITIDNTAPNAPTLTSPATGNSIIASATQTFTCGVTNANTTGCTIYFGRNSAYSSSSSDSSSASMTYSSSTCTYDRTFSTQADNGNWYWYCAASDGTNSTNSAATNVFTVGIPGNAGGGSQVKSNVDAAKTLSLIDGSSGSKVNLGTIVLAILVIALIYFIFKKK